MRFLLLICLVLNTLGCTQTYVVHLGQTPVKIVKHAGKGKVLIHLHQNEKTALQAAKLFVKEQGGTLIWLEHPGQRNIVFYLKNKRYEFDPNRIFTDVGIRNTLKTYSSYTPVAHHEVAKLANIIKYLLPEGKIIAVHNNRHYSMKWYFPNQVEAENAQQCYYRPHTSYRNFYLVTQKIEYERLKLLPSNVVLQSLKAKDDGSLAIYWKQKNYINIESAHGALEEQLNMIRHA